ncbi:MAG: transcriptional repressor [Candidatus Hydrogenedentota bacterium]|nr:MAG: transcriptional repressor [Candidatus Hydrogenedentota bacterium]
MLFLVNQINIGKVQLSEHVPEKERLSKDAIRDLFRRKSVHVTNQRLEMAYLLLNRRFHFTAEEANRIINEKFPKVSRSTVFNILSLFTKIGFLKKLEIHSGFTVYDSNMEDHHHFVEQDTGEVRDILTDQKIQTKIEKEIRKILAHTDPDIVPESIEIIIRGKKKTSKPQAS